MTARNPLLVAPPHQVEQALQKLGADLRTARLMRNLTIAEVAQKIGTGSRAIGDAEKGKPSTSIAIYAALLWTFDLLGNLKEAADPGKDEAGKILARAKRRRRARSGGGLNNDF
jgi:transcriptional regulator with XRE-family HTH domain